MNKRLNFKDVNSEDDFWKFMKYWETKLLPVSINSVFDKEGKYYIKTRNKKVNNTNVTLIQEEEFNRILKNHKINLDSQQGFNNGVGLIAEYLTIKKLMKILYKYKEHLEKPFLLYCEGKQHALFDIKIPCINLYMDCKGHNLIVFKIAQEINEREKQEVLTTIMTHPKNEEKNRVVFEYVQLKNLIELKYFAVQFSINHEKNKNYYLNYIRENTLNPTTIVGSALPGREISTDIIQKELIKDNTPKEYVEIKHYDKTEKEFLKEIEERIKEVIKKNENNK